MDVELTAALVHQLSQPLCGVVYNLGMARRQAAKLDAGGEEGKLATWLADAQVCADHLMEVVRDVRARARGEVRDPEPCQLGRVLERAARITEGEARLLGTRIEVDCATEAAILGSETRLVQLFVSLLLDVIDAVRLEGPRRTPVRVRLRDRVGAIAVEIGDVDTPPESTYEETPAGWSSRSERATGMRICQRIVGAHGGRLMLRRTDGGGRSTLVVFPRTLRA